jgi:hypothetical protein
MEEGWNRQNENDWQPHRLCPVTTLSSNKLTKTHLLYASKELEDSTFHDFSKSKLE